MAIPEDPSDGSQSLLSFIRRSLACDKLEHGRRGGAAFLQVRCLGADHDGGGEEGRGIAAACLHDCALRRWAVVAAGGPGALLSFISCVGGSDGFAKENSNINDLQAFIKVLEQRREEPLAGEGARDVGGCGFTAFAWGSSTHV